MKKFAILAVLILVVVSALNVSAAEIERFRYSGESAGFSASNWDGCAWTGMYLAMGESKTQSQGRPVTNRWAYVQILKYDVCIWREGAHIYLSFPVENLEFSLSPNHAYLRGTVNAFDYATSHTFTVAVNAEWKAVPGSVDQNMWKSTDGPNGTYKVTAHGTVREAEASAFVSVNGGANLVANDGFASGYITRDGANVRFTFSPKATPPPVR